MPTDETPQGYQARAAAGLRRACSAIRNFASELLTILLVSLILIVYECWLRLCRFPAWFRDTYARTLHRHVENIGLVGALAVTFGLSYVLYVLDPRTPSLSVATLQVIVLAPFLFFVALHVAIWTYKHLLPVQFKAFIKDLGEQITAPAMPPLDELLAGVNGRFEGNELEIARFKLTYDNLRFKRKCARYLLFGLPLLVFFVAMLAMLYLVLNLQPH